MGEGLSKQGIILHMPDDSRRHNYREVLKRRMERPIDARVRRVTIHSTVLGVAKSFYVALPPGYHRVANAQQRYPTVYLFRGHEREWVHRFQDNSRRGRTVIDVYRRLLAESRVGPMILVFPGISSDDNRIPGMLVNFREPELVKGVPGIGSGRFEDYFLQELVPCVDTRYRTIAGREGRAVDGFSLGGFQSIKIAAQHPDLFVSAGSFDGMFLFSTYRGRSVRIRDRLLRDPMFGPAFGAERDLDFVAANNPANLLWRNDRSVLTGVQWLIRSGPRSAEPWQSNYFRAQHITEIMKARKIDNGLDPVLRRAKHHWLWADRHVEGTLPLHWQAMRIP
jgi:hypothetical protein